MALKTEQTDNTVMAPTPPKDFPDSNLLNPESIALIAEWNQQYQDFSEACSAAKIDFEGKDVSQIPALRLQQSELFYQSPLYQNAMKYVEPGIFWLSICKALNHPRPLNWENSFGNGKQNNETK